MNCDAWYNEKHDFVSTNIKFHFSTIGQAGDYYLVAKSNICVVCGSDKDCLRKYIVPHEYRKLFPEVMRDHQSHDVLLMCLKCHRKSNL